MTNKIKLYKKVIKIDRTKIEYNDLLVKKFLRIKLIKKINPINKSGIIKI